MKGRERGDVRLLVMFLRRLMGEGGCVRHTGLLEIMRPAASESEDGDSGQGV